MAAAGSDCRAMIFRSAVGVVPPGAPRDANAAAASGIVNSGRPSDAARICGKNCSAKGDSVGVKSGANPGANGGQIGGFLTQMGHPRETKKRATL